MAYDEALGQRIRDFLSDLPAVTERKMFGALVFLLNGNMIGGPMGTSCLVRVGKEDYDAVIADGVARPMQMSGRTMRGFVVVDEDAIASDEALAEWVQIGVDEAASLPPKPGY